MIDYYIKDKTLKCTRHCNMPVALSLVMAVEELDLTVDGPTPESHANSAVLSVFNKFCKMDLPLEHSLDGSRYQ